MAIEYPLSLPTTIGMAKIELRAVNAVALSRSPFTFSSQVHAYSGQMWQADVSIPPVRKDLAESWVAFLLSLQGQKGTFLMGDPNNATPRGIAGQGLVGSPVVLGSNQTGGTLNIIGASRNKTGWLLAGDYIQIGEGSSAKLHKVLQDVDTGNLGEAAIELWPHMRTAPANGTLIIVSDTKGLFRLSSNEVSWSINELNAYGITFGAVEAL